MAFLGQEYLVKDLPAGNNFDPVPAGWYTVKIVEAPVKDTKAGTGQYIAVRYDILGPSYQGRVIFGNLNIKNPNPQAEEIGRQQMGDLARAIGLEKLSDSDQLIGGVLQIKVSVRKQDGYEDQNDVKGFKPADGAVPMSAKPSTPFQSTTPAQAKSATPPWGKK